jgi:hypothetical protein
MLLVNFEAREVTREVYKPLFKQVLGNSVYLNLNIDFLYIAEKKAFCDWIMDRTMNWDYNPEERHTIAVHIGHRGSGGLTSTAKGNIGIDFKERIVRFQSSILYRRRGLRTWSL